MTLSDAAGRGGLRYRPEDRSQSEWNRRQPSAFRESPSWVLCIEQAAKDQAMDKIRPAIHELASYLEQVQSSS